MPYGILAADQIQSSVTGVSLGAGNATRFKNRLINSDMRIDQRNAGAAVNPANGYSLDRWRTLNTNNTKWNVQQNAGAVTPPTGFTNYLGITSASAYTPTSTDTFNIIQRIEGLNIADLGWGTANAKTVTVSFWVRSSLTGTFSGGIQNNAQDRAYVFSYTISAANTWEYKTVTIAGDTTGTWLTTNGIGLVLMFNLGVGSNFMIAPNTWTAGEDYGVLGQVNLVATNGATWYVTGVQLEVGESATGFEYVDYGTQLQMCMRYYQAQSGTNLIGFYTGSAGGSNNYRITNIQLPVWMRTSPTCTVVGQNTGNAWYFNSVNQYNLQTAVNIGSNSGEYNVTSWTASAEL